MSNENIRVKDVARFGVFGEAIAELSNTVINQQIEIEALKKANADLKDFIASMPQLNEHASVSASEIEINRKESAGAGV